MKKTLPIAVLCGASLLTLSFSGCETPGQGAGTGAITGAIIGGIAGNNVRGAAIGAGAGALAGAVLGKIAQDERRAGYVEGYYAERPVYRVATPSRYCGYVISPYRPHALVDVRGIRPGARVVDPASDRVFINP
jgi:hypothetical protein